MTNQGLSVALCTCNGEKYIEKQLSSILQQDVPVDEIVVSDDLSTDTTIAIVERIAATTAIPIRILRNDTSVHYGVCANFEKAIAATVGDIILFSDQDDVWLPTKTKTIVEWFSNNPSKDVLFTNAWLIDDEDIPYRDYLGNPLTMVHNLQTDEEQLQRLVLSPYLLEAFLNGNIYTGATMAVRRPFVEGVPLLRLGEGKLHHDAIVALLGIDKQTMGFCSTPTISYRIHRGQVCGMPIRNTKYSVRTVRQFLPPCGSYLTGVDYAQWPLSETTKKRIRFYGYRYGCVKNSIRFVGGGLRYFNVYSNLYLWRIDMLYCIEEGCRHIVRYIKKRLLRG